MYLRSLLDYEPEWATQHEDTMEQIAWQCRIGILFFQMRRSKMRRWQRRFDALFVVCFYVLIAAVAYVVSVLVLAS